MVCTVETHWQVSLAAEFLVRIEEMNAALLETVKIQSTLLIFVFISLFSLSLLHHIPE